MAGKSWKTAASGSLADKMFFDGEAGYFKLYKAAAENGDPDAMFRLGYCYANGLDCRKDERRACLWYEKAAEKDHCYGLYYAAVCYANGKGCAANPDKALLYARKAEKAGNRDAKVLIADIRRLKSTQPDSYQYVLTDFKTKDMRELRRVISQIVSREFQNRDFLDNFSHLEELAKPVKIRNAKELEVVRTRAELGDDVSMLLLGRLYLEKDPDEVNPSADIAYYWIMKSAKAGNIDALKQLISMFAGDVKNTTYLKVDSAYAWELLRLLSWIHVDGILMVKDWYEQGRFLDGPNYVEMLEACKGFLNYHIVPKRYLPDWREVYLREKKISGAAREQGYIDLFSCLHQLQGGRISENYTKIAREYIDKALKEEADIMKDLAGMFLYWGRTDLLEYLASVSENCSDMISTLYTGKMIEFRYHNSIWQVKELEVKKDFVQYIRFSYYYAAEHKHFISLLQKMAEMLSELYYQNDIESLKKIVKVIRTFNLTLKENEITGKDLEIQMLDLLQCEALQPDLWKESILHEAKLKTLECLLTAQNPGETLRKMNKLFLAAEMCFPKTGEMFTCLPMASNREEHFTYYEELMHQNYDLSEADFSAMNRFDIWFDNLLWEVAKISKSLASSMMVAKVSSWDLPEGMELELDRAVEKYLNTCKGQVYGYWPGLQGIDIVHYSRYVDGKSTHCARTFTYMKSWEQSNRNPAAEYIRVLKENKPESENFTKTLMMLYRYYTFRLAWYQALAPEGIPESIDFNRISAEWKENYLHFAEMVVRYVESR